MFDNIAGMVERFERMTCGLKDDSIEATPDAIAEFEELEEAVRGGLAPLMPAELLEEYLRGQALESQVLS